MMDRLSKNIDPRSLLVHALQPRLVNAITHDRALPTEVDSRYSKNSPFLPHA
jgi:hypothetical protein